MRALNSSSFSPCSGRNCHWLRNSAVSLMKPAMSSIEMPFTTSVPRNGGLNTSLSVATSGERAGRSTGSSSSAPGFTKRPRSSMVESIGTRPQSGSSSVSPRLVAPMRSITWRPSKASLP